MNGDREILETLKRIEKLLEGLNKKLDEVGFFVLDYIKTRPRQLPRRY